MGHVAIHNKLKQLYQTNAKTRLSGTVCSLLSWEILQMRPHISHILSN